VSTVAGPASNKGCPEVTAEAMEELKMQARFIYFNSGKSTFKRKDVPQRLMLWLMFLKLSNSNFLIEGHTDAMVVMNTTKVFLMTELLLLKKL
jgi:outer membrane protein OmpA-like peptidoglycan-associated protein